MKKFLFSLLSVLIFAAPLFAQMREVRARIDGLTWPFCAYGLEKRLKKMDEVARVSINQPKGLVVAEPKPGKVIDLQAVNDAIRGAGFTPREIEVTVTGRPENWNGRATLVVNEIERYFLEPSDKVKQIEQAIGTSKKLVTLTGLATHPDAHREHPYTISVKTFLVQWSCATVICNDVTTPEVFVRMGWRQKEGWLRHQ